MRLIFLPTGLHQFAIPYPASFLSLETVLSFGIVFSIGVFLWFARKNRLVMFSVLSSVLFLFPVLNIIPTAATTTTITAMRWLYLPMAFLSLGWAWVIQRAMAWNRSFTLAVQGMVLVYFGVYTVVLNAYFWHDHDKLITQEVYRFNNYQYAGDLAEILAKQKKYPEADRYFRIAIQKAPGKAHNAINYAAFLTESGKAEKAILVLLKSKNWVMTHHERAQWFNNMGMAHFTLRRVPEAINYFLKATRLCKDEAFFWANLGGAYGTLGDHTRAVFSLEKGLDLAPRNLRLRMNLAITHMNMGAYEKAVQTLENIPRSERRGNKDIQDLLDRARNGRI